MDRRDRYFVWYSAGASALVLAYVLIFMATSGIGLASSFVTALANILPLVALGFAVRPIALTFKGRPLRFVVIGLAVMACLWSLCWYVSVAVTIGIAGVVFGTPFQLVWLQGPALLWQSYQGLVVFALICTGHYALELLDQVANLRAVIADNEKRVAPSTKPTTIMMKTDDGLVALELAEITVIEADDDASIIVTRKGRFKSRQSLAKWGEQLEKAQFVRIHRSRIVNLERLISAEPIGEGRLMVHLEGGQSVEASRAGARLLKEISG